MERELPRTIRSLSPGMQHGVQASDYEIVVADNGSSIPIQAADLGQWGAEVRIVRPRLPSPSPARAINLGLARARGELIGAMIDGARIASPGILTLATMASRLAPRVIVLTLAFHLGPGVQSTSVRNGYNQSAEDELLERSGWTEDPYRLFQVSALGGSSANGWFAPMHESSAVFMDRELWQELGGFDERFEAPGGGLLNLDLLERAVQLPQSVIVTLLGEGTFHQFHGGVVTNTSQGAAVRRRFGAEYRAIRGRPYRPPVYETLYLGLPAAGALASISASPRPGARLAAALQQIQTRLRDLRDLR
jgi:hypothetical protein